MTSTDFSENALVEQPAIALFENLDYATANCLYEKCGGATATLGRETTLDTPLVTTSGRKARRNRSKSTPATRCRRNTKNGITTAVAAQQDAKPTKKDTGRLCTRY